MTQLQHMHLPLTKKKSLKPVDEEFDYAIYDNKNEIIAEVFGRTSKENRPNAEAHAAFIVCACNNHYKLIEALEISVNTLKNCGSGDGYGVFVSRHQAEITFLNRVLNQAKGEL